MDGIGSHTKPNRGATDDWITPKAIIDKLGPFDLDPCQCEPQPWSCAAKSYNFRDNGLTSHWEGRVWLNPPLRHGGEQVAGKTGTPWPGDRSDFRTDGNQHVFSVVLEEGVGVTVH